MRKMNIARRRGTTIAAAALSMALVAPVVQPVVNPAAVLKAQAQNPDDDTPGGPPADYVPSDDQNPAGGAAEEEQDPGDVDSGVNKNLNLDKSGEPIRIGERGRQPILGPLRSGGQPSKDAPATAAGATENTPYGTVFQDGTIWVDALSTGRIDSATQFSSAPGVASDVVSGRAQIVDRRKGGTLSSIYDGYTPVAEGTVVYFQFVDRDGSVSPIFAAKTHNQVPGVAGAAGDGVYAFLVPKWTDANGTDHTFLTGATERSYRLFAEDTTNPTSGNKVEVKRVAGNYLPYKFTTGFGSGLGEFPGNSAASGNMQKTALWFDEPTQDYMKHPDAKEDTLGPLKNQLLGWYNDDEVDKTTEYGYYSGNVWLENASGGYQQLTAAQKNGSDPDAVGYRVYVSTLTAEGDKRARAIWDGDPTQRAALTKQMLEEHPEYLAGTWYAETDENGDYTIRVPRDKYSGEHFYMWVEDPQGNPVTTVGPFSQPVFPTNIWGPTTNATEWNATTQSRRGGIASPAKAAWRHHSIGFAVIASTDVTLDIVNYDTTARPFRPGEDDDAARLVVRGDMSPLGNVIEWRNGRNEVVKDAQGNPLRCEITSPADLKECATFTPADPKDGEVYSAVLIQSGNEVARDSFKVVTKKDDGTDAQKFDPRYEGAKFQEGDGGEVDPTWYDSQGNPTQAPKGPNGELPDFTRGKMPVKVDDEGKTVLDPNGYPVREEWPKGIDVEEDGTITVAKDTPKGNYTVPVVVTYPDGSRETIFAEIKVVDEPVDNDKPGVADEITPSWENTKTPANTPVEVPNVGEKLPEGTTVTATSDDNWKVEVDGDKVTVTPPKDAKTGDKSTVYVTVTYPDGSVDVEKFTVTVQNDDNGDGDPSNDGDLATQTTPDWKNSETTPKQPVTVENTGDKLPAGSTVEVPATVKDQDGNEWEVTQDPQDPSKITVTPHEDAKPGSKVEVPVKVTYTDGSADEETFTVTVTGVFKVEYDEAKGKVDEDIVAKPKKTAESAELPKTGVTYTAAPKDDAAKKAETHDGLWTIGEPDAASGEVTAKVEAGKLKDRYEAERKKVLDGEECKPGETFDKQKVDDLLAELNPLFSTATKVNVTFGEGTTPQNDVPVTFVLTDKNGTPLAQSNDWDGDGVDNETEIRDCKNPLDGEDQNTPSETPATSNHWAPTEITPGGTEEIPNTGEKFPAGTTFETEVPEGWTATVGENQELTVTAPPSAKKDDKVQVVVTVTPPNGGKPTKETVEITVVDSKTQPGGEDNTKPTIDPVEAGTKEIKGKGDRPGETILVTIPGVKDPIEAKTDDKNVWKVPVPPTVTLKPGDKINAKDGNGNDADTVTVTDTTKPGVNDVYEGDKEITGTGRPGEKIIVTFPDGKTKETTVRQDGEWTVEVPEGTKLKKDDVITVSDGDGNKTDVTVGGKAGANDASSQIDGSKCVPTLLGFGLPLLALVPLGIAAQSAIPGLSSIKEDIGAQIRNANTELQKQLGILDPNLAKAHENFNAQIAAAGADLSQVLFGLAALAYGIAAIATIATNCAPQDGPVDAAKQSSNANIKSNIPAGSSGREGSRTGEQ